MWHSKDQETPSPNPPLRAGGGRPSTLTEYETVKAFSPAIQEHLKKIYRSLTAYSTSASTSPDIPPLASHADFQAWFESPAAAALAPPPKTDLSYPISNYFISSSHNTYLSGNQIYGSASADAYRNVLLRGCRSLEIDVWDGEDEDTSVSSSDYEEYQQAHRKEHRHGSEHGSQQEHAHEGTRERANSALNRLTHRVKDKAARMRPPARSPSRRGNSGSAEHVTRQHSNSLDVPTISQLKELKAEPRVYHGYTLTKDIPFRVICQAIRDSAFEATDLPLIVSLEVHCCLEQQETMVDIMRTVFDNHLVDISSESKINALPSPDQLRNKILIKVKWTPAADSGESNNPLEQAETSDPDDGTHASNPEKKKKATKILQALSDLGVYTRAYTFKHFDQPEAKIPTHVFSLSEAKVENLHQDAWHGPALLEHNRNFLMRVFPSSMRVNSSNVEPCFLWRQGAQMVALNWQKLDKGTMLNEGMFAGEDGWVLKPHGFRGVCTRHNDGVSPASDPARHMLDLEIEVIAAQNLPLQPGRDPSHFTKMKPYVKFQLHVDTHGPPGKGSGDISDTHTHSSSRYKHGNSDGDGDEVAQKLKRKTKTSRTSDPDFGGEILEWRNIHDVVEELSFLRLKVNDDRFGKDELIAWACIKLSRLKTGYRFVHLLDTSGAPCGGALLLRISKRLHQ